VMEKFLLGIYTMVQPADVRNRLAADSGLDAPPDPPLTDAEMERIVFAAKQELLRIMRARAVVARKERRNG